MTIALKSIQCDMQAEGLGVATVGEPSEENTDRQNVFSLGTGSVVGTYVIICQLSQDPLSVTFEAASLVSQTPVALKVLRPEWGAIPGLATAWNRWTEALKGVVHPAIASCIGAGGSEEGPFFLASELLHGVTLRDRLDTVHPDSVETLGMLRTMVEGLIVAHDAGMVHGDIRPDNVFCDVDGNVKLLDFGLLECLRGVAAQRGVNLLASPAYVSPEQIAGEVADAQSDLYALGLVAYECLAGRHPLVPDGRWPAAADLLVRQIEQSPGEGLGIAEHFLVALRRSVAKSPPERIGSARELLAALQAVSLPVSGAHPHRASSTDRREEPTPIAPANCMVSRQASVPRGAFRDSIDDTVAARTVGRAEAPPDSAEYSNAARPGIAGEALGSAGIASRRQFPSPCLAWPYGHMLAGILLGVAAGVAVFLWRTMDLAAGDRGDSVRMQDAAPLGGGDR